MKVPLSLLLSLVALVVWTTPASAKTTPVTQLARETPVRAYDGWLLFSRWDDSSYHLSAWHDGQVRDLAVPASHHVFDADIGPGADGRPQVIVSRCASSCDLYVVGVEPGDHMKAVRSANTSRDEIAPTISEGRIAFGRRFSDDRVLAYTQRLTDKHAKRLADLPETRCGAVIPPDCRPIADVNLQALELDGRWVAESWTYQPKDFPGHSQAEMRLTDVKHTDTRQLAAMTVGEGEQTYLAPSIADGQVAFFRACFADRSGCSPKSSGAIRYDISSRRYELDGISTSWTGWAWNGSVGFHVPSEFDCRGGDPSGPPGERCAIYRRDGLDWTSVSQHALR
jgi:hypothetical protein